MVWSWRAGGAWELGEVDVGETRLHEELQISRFHAYVNFLPSFLLSIKPPQLLRHF
jgi:hypothetical protein